MRRILVLLALALLAAGGAEAASAEVPVLLRTPGAEFVELRGGNGRAVIARRGSLFVNIGSGRLRLIDLPAGGRPNLNPQCQRRSRRVSRTTIEISGRSISCRIWSGRNGGPWQVVIRGRRISASGVVKGSLTLDAADTGPTGQYKIAGGGWASWPREPLTIPLSRT